jgi:hypothetical protein
MKDSDLQQKRILAALIDVGIAVVMGLVVGGVSVVLGVGLGAATHSSGTAAWAGRVISFVGALVMLAYMLGRDLLAGDRSLGKKLMEIRVVTSGGSAIGLVDSVKRNAIFAIGSVLSALSATLRLVPCLGDAVACLLMPLTVLGGLVGFVAAIVELVKIIQDPDGVRFGDQWAGTKVIR